MAREVDVRLLLRIAIAVLCVGATVLAIAIATAGPSGSDESGKALVTAVLLGLLSPMAAAGATLVRRQPGIALIGYATIAATVAAVVIVADRIWVGSFLATDGVAHAAWYSIIGTLALGNTSAVLAAYDDAEADSVRLLRVATVLALWALVITGIAEIRATGRDVDPRQLGVTAVVYGLCALVLPLLSRAQPRRHAEGSR